MRREEYSVQFSAMLKVGLASEIWVDLGYVSGVSDWMVVS